MEIKGKFHGLQQDYNTGDLIIAFVASNNAENRNAIEKLDKENDLRIKAVKWTEKRSLNANSYFHLLVGKIADSLNPPISKAHAKNIMITRYGQPEIIDNCFLTYETEAPPEYMWELESLHAIPIQLMGNKTKYKIYRGSHTYNTKEMSILIDGTVQEAQALGIETLTPEELQRLKDLWQSQ